MFPTTTGEPLRLVSKPQILLVISFVAVIAIAIYALLVKSQKNKGVLKDLALIKSYIPQPVKVANNKERKLGTWKSEVFDYPPVEEFEGWSINGTKPLPYRAFKHTYFVTMGIRSMDWNSWIELDNEWMKYHQRKVERLQERRDEIVGTPDEVWDAAIEWLMEFREYLPVRYPTMFKKTEKGIDNIITGEVFQFLGIPRSDFKKDPMEMAALMTQDDLAIMKEDENGQYILKGGAIMLAGFWRLKDKINLPLSAIHTTGEVPKYSEKLKTPMEKFFVRLTCDKPVVRNNYFIQTDDDVAWSSSIGPEDRAEVGWNTADVATSIDQLYYRSERQSVRRLPITGCITFTIRTYFMPITKMCEEPFIPKRLLDAVLSWDDDVKRYRGYEKFKDVLIPYLEEQAKLQEQKGYTVDQEPNNYPY